MECSVFCNWAEKLNTHFSKDSRQMVNRYIKMLNITKHKGNAK